MAEDRTTHSYFKSNNNQIMKMSATNPELSLSLTKEKQILGDKGYWLGDLLSA